MLFLLPIEAYEELLHSNTVISPLGISISSGRQHPKIKYIKPHEQVSSQTKNMKTNKQLPKQQKKFLLYAHINMLRSQHFVNDLKFSITAS